MTKYFYCDLETGGVDKKKHPILQIAGAIEIDGEIKQRFEWFVKPFLGQELDPQALEVNNIKPEDISKFQDPVEVFKELNSLLRKYVNFWDKTDKFHFVGYNSKFDFDFLREFFLLNSLDATSYQYGNGFGNFFWVPPIDVMGMAAVDLIKNRGNIGLINFKLGTVIKYYDLIDLENTDFHDAKFDIDVTIKLFKFLLEKNSG